MIIYEIYKAQHTLEIKCSRHTIQKIGKSFHFGCMPIGSTFGLDWICNSSFLEPQHEIVSVILFMQN